MIILYDSNETKFDSLGIGVLTDASSCLVKESLNDAFELEMEYPITGQFYSEIEIGRILSVKPNPFADNQPFRISYISKPINGIVTVGASHISYDMNGIIVGPISATSIEAVLNALETNAILEHNFKFKTDIQSLTTFQTKNYYNMRSLLFGSDESILETYKLEILFDRFYVYLLSKRGSDKGCEIRYGKNMIDLDHEVSSDRLYNGVYPYYYKETSQTNVDTTTNDFTKAYIVGSKPLQDGWLSFEEAGEPYHPIDVSPVKIATQGEYYGKVFTWDSSKQRYIERLCDQTVILIEGAVSPEWIYIDWSGLPSIVVKANKPGYFKMMTDTEYTHHDVGDIVYQGSIRTVMENLVLYYSEVIPGTSSSLADVSSSVTHTDMTDKILWIDTELAHNMGYNRILALDLTSKFENDEEVNDENLKKKALEYIKENKIGEYKYNTTVSFIDLTQTTDDIEFKNIEKIELGDIVKVIYDGIGVNIELRAISVTYDALLNRYDSIELGEKSETISSSSVQTGDNISSLSNDKGYTTQPEVVSIVAKTITADYITAANAKLSAAQIEQLSTERIKCTGLLEASQAEIDKLVAKMLVADNAEIKNTLEAGNIKVSGDVTIKSGEILIQNEDGTKMFSVDRDGNLIANSAKIYGLIEASEGHIGAFTINDVAIFSNQQSMIDSSDKGVYIGPDGLSIGKQLKIYPDGRMISATSMPTIDPSLPQRQLSNDLETTNRASDVNFGYKIKGNIRVALLNVLNLANEEVGDVYNLSDFGDITNGSNLISVKTGDNVVVGEVDGNKGFFPISDVEFLNIYRYEGPINVSTLNQYLAAGDPESFMKVGSIYQIKNKDADLIALKGTQIKLDVSEGDFVVFYRNQLLEQVIWGFSKYYYKTTFEGKFFGLTEDGILYANGAIISGDITVKSGEINIQSEDGSKVFRVTRDGNVYANNVNLVGQISAISGEIGGFLIDQDSIYVIDPSTLNKTSSLTSFTYLGDYGIPQYCAYIKGINWYAEQITFKDNDYDPYEDGSRLIRIDNYSIDFIGTSGTSTHYDCSISYNLNQNACRLLGTWIGTIIPPSDIKLKKDINTIDDKYSILFDNLNPRIYKFNDGTSDRYHTGFIVQEVLKSMEKAGISSNDYGLCCAFGDPNDPDTNWGLKYDELIALCVKEIQNLKIEIQNLKSIINKSKK